MKIEKIFDERLKKHVWTYDVTIKGKRRRSTWPHCKSEPAAFAKVAQLMTKAEAEKLGLLQPRMVITLGDLKAKIDADKAGINPQALTQFDQFVTLTGAETDITEICRVDWVEWNKFLVGRKLENGSITRYTSLVHNLVASARDRFRELADWEPRRAVWPKRSEGRSNKRLLELDDVGKLLAAACAPRMKREHYLGWRNRIEVYDLFRLMLLIPSRPSEILELDQSRVAWDFKNRVKTVTLISRKGKDAEEKKRVIPLSDMALAILDARRDRAPRFFDIYRDSRLYRAALKICKVAGLPYGRGAGVEGGLEPYDFRHLAATILAESGIPEHTNKYMMGHGRYDPHDIYVHIVDDTKLRAVRILEGWCRDSVERYVSSIQLLTASDNR